MEQSRIVVENVRLDQHPEIRWVYERVGYNGGIDDNDNGFLARVNQKPVGAVRLSRENGVLVLRGMMVLPEFQRQGIGKALLKILDTHIATTPCYCINPPHLENFYSSIGFSRIDPLRAPAFLAERLERYGRETHECIMMHRNNLL